MKCLRYMRAIVHDRDSHDYLYVTAHEKNSLFFPPHKDWWWNFCWFSLLWIFFLRIGDGISDKSFHLYNMRGFYTYTHIHIYTYTRIHVYTYTNICVYILCAVMTMAVRYVYIPNFFCRIGDGISDKSFHLYDMEGLLYTYTPIHIYTHTHIHIYTYTHIQIYAYTYYVPSWRWQYATSTFIFVL